MAVKVGFFKKISSACSRILYLQTCEARDNVYYQLKKEEDGCTHFTESHQGLNKIINALKSPCSVKCLPVLFLDISIIVHYARHR